MQDGRRRNPQKTNAEYPHAKPHEDFLLGSQFLCGKDDRPTGGRNAVSPAGPLFSYIPTRMSRSVVGLARLILYCLKVIYPVTTDEPRRGIFRNNNVTLVTIAQILLLAFLVIPAYAEYISQPLLNKILPIIASAESSNNPNAVGSAGEIGLYQISPILLKDYNSHLKKNFAKAEYLFRPYVNEMVVIWYIQERIIPAIKKHNLPVNLARIIYCWNAGISVGINNPIPKTHRVKINGEWRTNKIYDKVYKDYWKGAKK